VHSVTVVPLVPAVTANSASSARRQRRVNCCDTEQTVGSDLPPLPGMKEEPGVVSAAYLRDLALAATATSNQKSDMTCCLTITTKGGN